MKKITDFSHFNISYMTQSKTSDGKLLPKEQLEVPESFCGGKVSVYAT